jgi:hypothetical protein
VLVMLMMLAIFVASSSARPLGGNAGARDYAAAATVSGESILELLKALYLQNLQAEPGASCSTHSPNVICSPPPPMG